MGILAPRFRHVQVRRRVYPVAVSSALKAVAFDAVGTLFHSRGSIGEIYRTIGLKYGADVPAPDLQRGFERHIAAMGTPIDKGDWKALVETVFLEHGRFPRFDDFFEEVYRFFQSDRGWMCYSETEQILQTLGDHRFKLAVVSNFDERLLGVLANLRIDRHFAAVVTPDSAGEAKPGAGIFIDASAQLDVRPEETLFVGDDPFLDVQAARSAGLKAVLLDRGPGGPQAGAVGDLCGILPILGIE